MTSIADRDNLLEAPDVRESLFSQAWKAFRTFRRTRPFWGCLVLSLGAYFIISPVLTTISAMVSMGAAGVSGWMIGAIMLAAAGVSLVAPSQRHFAGVVATIVAVASLVLTNLGGYLIGMVLGIVGAGLIFAWTPVKDPAETVTEAPLEET